MYLTKAYYHNVCVLYQEKVTKYYQNFKFQQPYEQALHHCSLILHHHMWSWTEKLGILPHLEAKDLAEFVPVMLSKAFLECYIAGSYKSLNFLCKFYLIIAILYYCHIMIPNVWVRHVTAATCMKELHLLVCKALY